MGIARAGLGGVSGLQNQSTADIIDGSVRFNTTNYLERTQTAGNQTTWTWSSWIKLNDLSGNNIFGMEGGYPNVSATFNSSGKIRFTAAAADSSVFFNLITEPQYRDLNAWYHVVCVYDSNNGESKDRGRIYINGKKVEHLDTAVYPSQGATTEVNNNGNEFRIASHSGVDHLDGYFSTIHFIDGQALGPHFFGFTDPLTNTWKPKKFDAKGTTYNDGTTWSNFATAYATPANAFDGNTSTAALYTVADEFVFTPPKPIRGSTLRLYVNTGSGSPIDVSTNGRDFTGIFRLENGAQYSELYEITDGLLTQLRIKTNAGGGGNIYQIIIDGEVLIDDTTTNLNFGVNGFHLPMDGNTHVGADQSGKGNDYFLYNFSGSVPIEKATGGLPTLNTTNGTHYPAAGVRTDAYASSLVLALPLYGDTEDISNQINGGSTTKTMTNSGSADSASETYFYGSSRYFDGSNDNLKTNDVNDFVSTAEYTIEGWINITSAPGNNQGEAIFDTGSGGSDPELNTFNNSGTLQMYESLSNNTNWDGAPLSTGRWYHFAQVVKGTAANDSSAVHKIYIDGKLSLTNTINLSNRSSSSIACIGSRTNDTVYGNFYLSDIRFYQIAKYDEDFTVASKTPDVVQDSPSGVSGSSKLANITDGGVTLDNKGTSHLSISASDDYAFGTGDFTVEGYFNIHSSGSNSCIWDLRDSGDSNQYFLKMTSNTACELRFGPGLLASFNIKNKRWNHIAVSRVGTTHKIFLNGVESNSFTGTYNATNTGPLIIGSYTDTTGSSSNFGFKGTVSNFRVIKGTGLYTSTFNPPVSPLTNVTNTKLLCCQSPTSATEAAVIPTGSVSANGSARATNFNPFNEDGSAVLGRQSGYVTFNALNNINCTLSDGDLKFVTGGNNSTVWADKPIPTSGKWYFESTFGGGDMAIMLDQEARRENRNVNQISTGLGIYMYFNTGDTNNRFQTNNNNTAMDTSFTGDSVGDVYMFEVDMDAGTVRVRKDDGSDSGLFTMPDALKAAPLFVGFTVTTTWPAVTQTFNFGQRPFVNAPTKGFQPLNDANLRPESVVIRPDQYVGVTTYTGDGGASNSISGLNFGGKPDLVWVKGRSYSISHVLYDSVRGAGSTKSLVSNGTNTEGSAGDNSTYGYVSSFDNNGYSLVGGSDVNNGYVNKSGASYVGWCWRAGGSKGTFNVDDLGYATFAASGTPAGTITPTGTSIGTRQGFSIIKYTGTGNADTLPHGLSQAPEFLLVKNLDSTYNWAVYHKGLSSAAYYLFLNNGDAQSNSFYTFWDSTDPSSTVISLGADSSDSNVNTNKASQSHICYAWTSVPGLQKFGTYEGNNSTDGPFVELGFRPAIVWTKNIDASASWVVYDNKRRRFNTNAKILAPNSAGGGNANDAFVGSYPIDILSNGFKIRNNTGEINASNTYIYCAWADAAAIDLFGGGANPI